MKTAISMPDKTFHRVTQTATDLGISRSELLTRAADAYLDELESESLTEAINRALDSAPTETWVAQDLIAAGKRRMSEIDDDW